MVRPAKLQPPAADVLHVAGLEAMMPLCPARPEWSHNSKTPEEK